MTVGDARVIRVDPRVDQRWLTLTRQDNASVFHAPAWIDVIAATYSLEPEALLLVDAAGAVRGGLHFCRARTARGVRIVSFPFSDFCDPLVSSAEDWAALADHLLALDLPVSLRTLHTPWPGGDPRLALSKRACWHALDVPVDWEAFLRRIDGSARRGINKAKRAGLEVVVAQDEAELRAFHTLHLQLRKRKYRLLAQPYDLFRRLWERFCNCSDGALVTARHQGEVVAGALFLRWGDRLYYKYSASAEGQERLRPMEAIIAQGVELARSLDCHVLDLGLSDWDQAGLIRFKRKFATQEGQISFLEHGADLAAEPLQAILPALTELFTDQRVPDDITARAGALLYRYFA